MEPSNVTQTLSTNMSYYWLQAKPYKTSIICSIGVAALVGLGLYFWNKSQSGQPPSQIKKPEEQKPKIAVQKKEEDPNKGVKQPDPQQKVVEQPKLENPKPKDPQPPRILLDRKYIPDVDIEKIEAALKKAIEDNDTVELDGFVKKILENQTEPFSLKYIQQNIFNEIDDAISGKTEKFKRQILHLWQQNLKNWINKAMNQCVDEYQDRESFIARLLGVYITAEELFVYDAKVKDADILKSVSLNSIPIEIELKKIRESIYSVLENFLNERIESMEPKTVETVNWALLSTFEKFKDLKSDFWNKTISSITEKYLISALLNEVDGIMLNLKENENYTFEEYESVREKVFKETISKYPKILNESYEKTAAVLKLTILHDWIENQLARIRPKTQSIKEYTVYRAGLATLMDNIGKISVKKKEFEVKKIEREVKRVSYILDLAAANEDEFELTKLAIAKKIIKEFEDLSFFVKGNKLDSLKEADDELMSMLKKTSVICDESLSDLDGNFLDYKIKHGTPREKRFYKTMDLGSFQNRLMTKRPLIFADKTDNYKTIDGLVGMGDFEAIGTSLEKRLYLSDTLSYDEIMLAATRGFSTPTKFINHGARQNRGQNTPCIPEGFYCGMVGARFENPGFMEDRYVVVRPGIERNTEKDKLWANHFQLDEFPSFEKIKVHKDQERFLKMEDGSYLDILVYKKIMKERLKSFIDKANAPDENIASIYAYVVGLGLGLWLPQLAKMSIPKAAVIALIQINIYREIIKENEYPNIEILDFGHPVLPGDYKVFTEELAKTTTLQDEKIPVKDYMGISQDVNVKSLILKDRNQKEIKMILSYNDPAVESKEKEGKRLVAMFAWDGGSFPGNEYWQGLKGLAASGDAAAACCSTICSTYPSFLLAPIVAVAKSLRI